MPREETRTLYKLEELKEAHPAAFEKVHDRWKEVVASDQAPWADETISSLRAVVKACGHTIRDYQIGTWGRSSLDTRGEDQWEDDDGNTFDKDAPWMLENILKPHGYTKHDAQGILVADFPGHCKFTDYCADDDFLEATYKALLSGDTLTQALDGLADNAAKMMENDVEQQQEEENMLANWGENEYDKDGNEV